MVYKKVGTRLRYIPENATERVEDDVTFYLFVDEKGEHCAIAFHGDSGHPHWAKSFPTEESREKYIQHSISIGKRSLHVPENATERVEHGVTFYLFIDEKERPHAIAFKGDKHHPYWAKSFQTEERRERYIQQTIKDIAEHNQEIQEYRRVNPQPFNLKVGDVLFAMWGLDYVYVEFYIVEHILGSDGVAIRRLAAKRDEKLSKQGGVEYLIPSDTRMGDLIEKRIRMVRHTPTVSLTPYSTAILWDGKPKRCSNDPRG